MAPKLSICIPTYNRAEELSNLLDSIFAENVGRNIEICISDNCSTDNTFDVIMDWSRHLPILYRRNSHNMGADLNFLSVVKMARTEYVMIMGSDDEYIPDGLREIVRVVSDNKPDVFTYNRTLTTAQLISLRDEQPFDIGKYIWWIFQTDNGLEDYFRRASSITAGMTYLSSIVFKKSLWDAVEGYQHMIGTSYVHSYKLLHILSRGAKLLYHNISYVNCRLGNDSFRDGGLFKRVQMDVMGMDMLSKIPRMGRIYGLLRFEYPLPRLLRYEYLMEDEKDWYLLRDEIAKACKYPKWKMLLIRMFGRLRPVKELSFFLRDHSITR